MANEEQLSILKQGVKVWNEWRKENPLVKIDLGASDLNDANLRGANLRGANLREANLSGAVLIASDLNDANLSQANFRGASLGSAILIGAVLRSTDLSGADLNGASLTGALLNDALLVAANLSETNLTLADLSVANLNGADLRAADLGRANLFEANLNQADFYSTLFFSTILANVDLSVALNLDTVRHYGPSSIGIDSIANSKGKIPREFLRGCGLSDTDIEYAKLFDADLNNEEINRILYKVYDLRATQALQISPLFISYSHGDSSFVDQLENQLNGKGIRFWRDIHEMKAGRLEKQISRAIQLNPTVLLILSEHSLKSDWVEHEVRKARELEKDIGRDVLCPVALDDSWKSSPWPKRVMEQIMEYNILDFSAWQDDNKFEGMFRKLIDGLQLFYKDKSHGE